MSKPPALRFPTELAAARHLLQESTATLLRHGVDFAVVGGWSAYLFHSKRYGHPGTFDVDILLQPESLDNGTFDRATEDLLGNGYLRAAKNVYQAHRIFAVNGEELVFHVDFLNERDPGNALELVGGTGRMKSIYTPAMKAVFRYANYRTANEFPGVRFPSRETFIVTKAAAAVVKKRSRDAFDVFITVQDQDTDAFKASWRLLSDSDGLFSDATASLREAVETGDAVEKIQAVLLEMQTAKMLSVAMPNESEIRNAFGFLADA
jgi:hypothetical protein